MIFQFVLIKDVIYRNFRLFLARNQYFLFKKQHIYYHSVRAFDWYMNCYTCVKKFFFDSDHKGGPLRKKNSIFFFHPTMTIHTPIESPYRVFSENEDFRNVWIDIWLRTPKNHVKIRILKEVLKNRKNPFSR